MGFLSDATVRSQTRLPDAAARGGADLERAVVVRVRDEYRVPLVEELVILVPVVACLPFPFV